MEYRISDLLDGMEDDCTRFSEGPAVSTERIREMTMKKINRTSVSQNADTPRRRLRHAWLAAAAAAVLVTSVAAVTISRRLQFRDVPPDETMSCTTADGVSRVWPDAHRVVTAEVESERARDVCFQAGYLPVDRSEVEFAGTYDQRLDYLAEQNGKDPEFLLKEAGMTGDEAKQWYTVMCHAGENSFFRIDLLNGAQMDGTDLLLDGEVTDVREGEINGMEAHYLTVEKKFAAGNGYSTNHILLYSGELVCMADICGKYGFDELEKIAEGLTLKETGLKAADTFDGNYSFLGGVG